MYLYENRDELPKVIQKSLLFVKSCNDFSIHTTNLVFIHLVEQAIYIWFSNFLEWLDILGSIYPNVVRRGASNRKETILCAQSSFDFRSIPPLTLWARRQSCAWPHINNIQFASIATNATQSAPGKARFLRH